MFNRCCSDILQKKMSSSSSNYVITDLDSVSTYGKMKTQRFDTSGNTAVTDVFLACCIMNFSEKKYKENCTKTKFFFKLKSFEAKWQKVFLLLTMRYSFYWKFALNIKLNVNILALIGSRLEINMNKYKKNIFSSILKIQPMAFQTLKTRTLTVKRFIGKLKTIRTNFKKAVNTNKRSGGAVVGELY